MEWELLGFLGIEGLDTRICWGFCRVMERKKSPGLKPIDLIGSYSGG